MRDSKAWTVLCVTLVLYANVWIAYQGTKPCQGIVRNSVPAVGNRVAVLPGAASRPDSTTDNSTHHHYNSFPLTTSLCARPSRWILPYYCFEGNSTAQNWATYSKACRAASKMDARFLQYSADCTLHSFTPPSAFCSTGPVERLTIDSACFVDCGTFRREHGLLGLEYAPRAHSLRAPAPPLDAGISAGLIVFDAAAKADFSQYLEPVLRNLASGDNATWAFLSFELHSVIGFNTFPNIVSLLTGFDPPGVKVDAPRRKGRGSDSVPFPRLYACTKEYRGTHWCTDPVLEPRWQQHMNESLFRHFSGQAARSYALMWDVPGGEKISTALLEVVPTTAHLPEHIGTGPFTRPDLYGDDFATDTTIRQATWRNRRCLGPLQLMNVQMHHSLQFNWAYRRHARFAFDLYYDTHDNANVLRDAAPSLRAYVQGIADIHADSQSVGAPFLFFTADHGPHTQERADLPIHHTIAMYVLVPKAFVRANPREFDTLVAWSKLNTHHRDLYWSLRNLAQWHSFSASQVPSGAASWFTSRPHQRTCSDANIVADYCGWKG